MPKITVLPTDLCNKISAGEVIERPASVVKELLENSLDAGSTEIKIEVSRGGKRLMRISDNGIGMDRDDALLCFKRHATSKITEYDDLFNISTLGFRGEALPSIASVSRLRLVTGLKGSAVGVSLELDGGELKDIKDAPVSGTTLEIKDLFFNTPVRKKFLKADSTELFHIIDIITKEALSHPETALSLFADSAETISLAKASGFRERIMQVYGEEFLGGLIEASFSMDGLAMHAFVSGSANFRKTRSHQFIFLNRRPIKDQSVAHAVYKAYEGILPPDKHMLFFLFLQIDPQKVDFNVHPTKREVRFEDKETIYRFIVSHLRDAIRSAHKEYAEEFNQPEAAEGLASMTGGSGLSYAQPMSFGTSVIAENLEFPYRASLPHIYLGDTFVAVSGKGGLTLLDHHAAHERVLFEKLLKGMEMQSTQLLFPRQVQVSGKEYRVLLEQKEIVRTFGIEIDDFGNNTVIVRAVPAEIVDADIPGLLSDIAAGLLDEHTSGRPLRYDLAARIACHGSIRGKKILSPDELAKLLEDLEKTEQPDQCPHGRPTRIFYSLHDLSKLFKRT
ncbi:MAG: DNA mismatch repair endonuclease MutL [Nitrospirae bacterium]|nr:DNA mismatch repair endonuclease MutL [Nitrospirota bacterium]